VLPFEHPMFRDLYDSVSWMFSRRWPKAEGVITAVDLRRYQKGSELVVRYKFLVGEDGPYTGESPSSEWLVDADLMSIHQTLKIGTPVVVRYRSDDPSVNKLHPSVGRDLEAW